MKLSSSVFLSWTLLSLSACNKDAAEEDWGDSGDTENSADADDTSAPGDTGSDEEPEDTGTEDVDVEDTGTEDTGTEDVDADDTDTETDEADADPVYDAGASLQTNVDSGVPILSILEHHTVPELYGLTHGGGYIFHIDETTGAGMVSHSLADSVPTHWNDFANPAPDLGLGSAIGDGEANTIAIVDALGEDTYAARYAFDAEINGFTDWFLPSIDELTAVYENLHLAELGDASASNSYWSSTDESTGAWVIYFANGSTYTPNKTHDHHHVLPVRNF